MTLQGKSVSKPEPEECEWCAKLFWPKDNNRSVPRPARFCGKTCESQFKKHHKGINPD